MGVANVGGTGKARAKWAGQWARHKQKRGRGFSLTCVEASKDGGGLVICNSPLPLYISLLSPSLSFLSLSFSLP